MGIDWIPIINAAIVVSLLSLSYTSGVQVFASDVSFGITNNISVPSTANHGHDELKIICAVGTRNNMSSVPLQVIKPGQSHVWKNEELGADHDGNVFLSCSWMPSFIIRRSLRETQDWIVTEDGLRRVGTTELSARWQERSTELKRISGDGRDRVAAVTSIIDVNVTNIMNGANPSFTLVEIHCTAKTGDRAKYLGRIQISAWESHEWKLTQIDNSPDTVFCSFSWTDDFRQEYTMSSAIFDSKSRNYAVDFQREYFVTKSGLAFGGQEVYVAVWAKSLTMNSP